MSDGVIELDAKGYVRFASPNSVSVLSRLKVDQVEGKRLGVEELNCESIPLIFSTLRPQSDEISLGGQTVTLKGIPLIEQKEMTGALLLIRDISELRRRDNLIRSKDSTIAEIHHRVKTICKQFHLCFTSSPAISSRGSARSNQDSVRAFAPLLLCTRSSLIIPKQVLL
ncbi:MAG: hypothetical protein CM15mP49_31750 [Actinomycetota bacterium]|nr:MAG: hypothetical protein CM15mP49_31750 [Actinomycetota bacterium]